MYVYITFISNKLFKSFILFKEIIMIIKTHIKFILNMYNLLSKFYWRERERERERERTCAWELKNTTPKRMNPK